ncbi:MAG TPA: polysaccharide deacetylase family protein, partial [Mucilaginibacter sp.]|nr:polysaccharide deacetylase family protein [Mucilaginibacter sp.]
MKKLLIIFLVLNLAAHAQQKIAWPKHKKAVIVLTYDDALLSQLNVAVPQLDSAHFKATFFLTGDIDYQTIPRWRALAKRGFELGNHTIFHP